MSGNFVATNLGRENAVLKEAYIKCRCQLLKANPTLAESFSETKGKATADQFHATLKTIVQIFMKIFNKIISNRLVN